MSIQDQVNSIIDAIENPVMHCRDCGCQSDDHDLTECPDCGSNDFDTMSAYDYLEDALDIEYIVGSDKQYRGARILVCFGGPNVWINTKTSQVEGYWWSDSFTAGYADTMGLDDAMQELWECS